MKKIRPGPLVAMKMAGGGKVDKTKRALLGLGTLFKPAEANLPIAQSTTPVSQVPTSPLVEFAKTELNKPMSRRQFLDSTAKTVASQAMRGVLPIAAKKAITKALPSVPAIDDEKAADKIAKYVTKIWGSSKAAKNAFKAAHGPDYKNYYGDLEDFSDLPNYKLWADLESGSIGDMAKIAKLVGLDLETVAQKTGLPLESVRKIAGEDGSLVDELAAISNKRAWLDQILEDGRAKEARRETSYLDLYDDEFMDQAAKKALKELGHDADDADQHAYDLMEYVDQEFQKRWRDLERGNKDPMQTTPLRQKIANKVIDDDTLDSVWEQATDTGDDGHIEGIFQYLEKNGWNPQSGDF